jgi:hypothetical protein
VRARVALLLAGLALASGCTADPQPEPSRPAPSQPGAPLRLDASVTQFRYQEGTRSLKAGITNDGTTDIRVRRATIAWDALAFPTVRLDGAPVPPGQTAAFVIDYGRARCAAAPRGRPVLVADVDGRTRRLPLRVEDPGLLRRLRARACAQQRLDRQVAVDLRPADRTRRIGGEEYLPADLVLRRRPGARTAVTLVDLGGSVLIDLTPRAGRRALPFRMAGGQARLSVPLLLGSAHRCDAHALGQSSQTYLLSAYLRLAARPTQRQILPLTSAERDRIIGVVDRDCH